MELFKRQPASTTINGIEDYGAWPWVLMLSAILSVATAMSVFAGIRTRHDDTGRVHRIAAATAITTAHRTPEPTDAQWTGIYTGDDADGLPVYRLPPVNVVASREAGSPKATGRTP